MSIFRISNFLLIIYFLLLPIEWARNFLPCTGELCGIGILSLIPNLLSIYFSFSIANLAEQHEGKGRLLFCLLCLPYLAMITKSVYSYLQPMTYLSVHYSNELSYVFPRLAENPKAYLFGLISSGIFLLIAYLLNKNSFIQKVNIILAIVLLILIVPMTIYSLSIAH